MAKNDSMERESPYRDIVEQLLDNASFLWILRENCGRILGFSANDQSDYELRLENQLDALMHHFEDAWAMSKDALQFNNASDCFVCSVLAFRSMDSQYIEWILNIISKNRELLKGLISAMAWLPKALVEEWLSKFIQSKDLFHKEIAAHVYRLRGDDSGAFLKTLIERGDCIQNTPLHVQCIRIIGEFKRFDLLNDVILFCKDDRESVAFWAKYSAVLLGKKEYASSLYEYVLSENEWQRHAVNIVFRSVSIQDARALIADMIAKKLEVETVLHALKVLGDPQAIPWIISQMENVQVSRLAGHVFSTITGISLDERELVLNIDEIKKEDLLDDFEDDDYQGDGSQGKGFDVDECENVSWPDVAKIKIIWQKYSHLFPAGQRLYLGKIILFDELFRLYKQTSMSEKRGLALELALIKANDNMLSPKSRVSAS